MTGAGYPRATPEAMTLQRSGLEPSAGKIITNFRSPGGRVGRIVESVEVGIW